MRLFFALAFAALHSSAFAETVLVSVLERGASDSSHFELNTASGTLARTAASLGDRLPSISEYSVRNYGLVRNAKDVRIGEAIEILAQSHVAEGDLVVVRQEYNSYSNPLRWLAASSGHPVQVSRIAWFLVSPDGTVRSGAFLSKAAAYHWSADLCLPQKASP